MNPLSLEGNSEFRFESQEGFRLLQFQRVKEGRDRAAQAEKASKWRKERRETPRKIVSD